jgi:hypothetical protein
VRELNETNTNPSFAIKRNIDHSPERERRERERERERETQAQERLHHLIMCKFFNPR